MGNLTSYVGVGCIYCMKIVHYFPVSIQIHYYILLYLFGGYKQEEITISVFELMIILSLNFNKVTSPEPHGCGCL